MNKVLIVCAIFVLVIGIVVVSYINYSPEDERPVASPTESFIFHKVMSGDKTLTPSDKLFLEGNGVKLNG